MPASHIYNASENRFWFYFHLRGAGNSDSVIILNTYVYISFADSLILIANEVCFCSLPIPMPIHRRDKPNSKSRCIYFRAFALVFSAVVLMWHVCNRAYISK